MHKNAVVVCLGLALLGTVGAENYYVRNRPFQQVVHSGGEALVGAEAFLKALGMGWTVEGNTVVVSASGGAAAIPTGALKFRYGSKEISLEGSARGGSVFVPLKPLARLCDFTVNSNAASGTVDVVKARFATDAEKKALGEAQVAREQDRKAREEAWAKRAEELRQRNASDGGEVEETPSASAPEASATPAAAAAPEEDPEKARKLKEIEVRIKDLERQPAKIPRLEVSRSQAEPDYATGLVKVECEVRNNGDAPAKPVGGTLVLTGPDQRQTAGDALRLKEPRISKSATDTMAVRTKSSGTSSAPVDVGSDGAPKLKPRVYLQKSVAGPALAPGQSWVVKEVYRFPGGSIPNGNFSAELRLNK